jgi:hypothetical protein
MKRAKGGFLQALEVKGEGGGTGGLKGEEEEEELEWLSNKDAFPAVETMAPVSARPPKNGVLRPMRVVGPPSSGTGRRCRHCGTERTPMWREGPEGRHTLCNACGVRYKTGRLLPEYRPLNSPSFRPELHSNRHSHVVEKRYRLGKYAKDSGGEEGSKGGGDLARLLGKDAVAFSGARPRTKGLRRPRRAVAWSPPPPPWRTPVSIGSAPAIGVWRTTAAQRLAASVAAAPIGGEAPRDEVGLGACTGGLVKQPPMDGDRPLAPVIEVGQRRRCGTDGTRQAPAAPVCWNCGVEQTPPPPAAKPATGQHQIQRCRPSETKNAPRAREAKSAAAAGPPLLCEPRETKNTPRAPAATAGQLLCEPNVTKNTSQVPAAKTKPATAVRQLLCGHREAKKTRQAPSAKPPAGQCKCHHCGTEETPQWRQGPDGPRTLCNACGVRYRAGCLVPEYRPLKSPSFSPELHSNIRRRVAQMCRHQRSRQRPAGPPTATADK